MKRIASVDIVRGLVMVIMAIDHVRDMFHADAPLYSPVDLAKTTPVLFFTRWITHLCAPTFVFLAGVSVFLTLKRKGDVTQMRRFLVSRGLWLLLLEFTVIGFGIWFNIRFQNFLFQVIAAIGCGFILLSLLLRVQQRILGLVGLLIICLHNLSPVLLEHLSGPMRSVPAFLLQPGFYPLPSGRLFIDMYPAIPWFGVMLAGYGAGPVFLFEESRQRTWLTRMGLIALVLFAVVRYSNFYGDPSKWSVQKDAVYTFLSFMNVTKYSPSMLYCLSTLGVSFLLLAFFSGAGNRLSRLLSVYGRVPFFYYLLHWYIAHFVMFAMLFLQGFSFGDFQFASSLGRPNAPNGLALWGVYLVWLGIVVFLYPLCRWYDAYKSAHREKKWLSYL